MNPPGKYGGPRPEKECRMPCRKDKKKMCGNGYRNSVYSLENVGKKEEAPIEEKSEYPSAIFLGWSNTY